MPVRRTALFWTIRSCAMADLVYQLGRTILEGVLRETQRESYRVVPLWRYDHPGVWSVVGRRKNGSARGVN